MGSKNNRYSRGNIASLFLLICFTALMLYGCTNWVYEVDYAEVEIAVGFIGIAVCIFHLLPLFEHFFD